MLERAYVEIGNICNLRCSFCHKTKRAPRQMTPVEFAKVLDKLSGKCKFIYLHLLGEPLCHPKLDELLNLAAERDFSVCITTNGTLLDQKGDILLKHCDTVHKVSISLHAPEGNGREESLASYISGVVGFAKQFSAAGGFSVFRLWNLDSAEASGKNGLNSYIESVLHDEYPGEWSARYSGFRMAERTFIEYDGVFVWPSESKADEVECGTCHALRSQVAILVDGTVVPCCLDSEGNMPLGNIFEKNLDDILKDRAAREMRQGFERGVYTAELCKKCTYARRFHVKGKN
jgi:radical SAM protein with 4Fe4S-binding SPASM domain